jgi:uncharacterized protein YjbJ (UPF0337 family)
MEDRNMEQRGMENKVEGKGDQLKGRVKDAAGGLTNDNEMQAEGKWDKMKGKAKDALGDVQNRLSGDQPRDR